MVDTPRCNALESNPLDSFDHLAWITLARELERELAAMTKLNQIHVRKLDERHAPEENAWQPIATAPKDGQAVWILSAPADDDYGPDAGGVVHRPAKAAIGCWNPDGDSWVDEHGQLGRDCVRLEVTGTWSSGGGWFQPNEVTHWMPLPNVPLPQGDRSE